MHCAFLMADRVGGRHGVLSVVLASLMLSACVDLTPPWGTGRGAGGAREDAAPDVAAPTDDDTLDVYPTDDTGSDATAVDVAAVDAPAAVVDKDGAGAGGAVGSGGAGFGGATGAGGAGAGGGVGWDGAGFGDATATGGKGTGGIVASGGVGSGGATGSGGVGTGGAGTGGIVGSGGVGTGGTTPTGGAGTGGIVGSGGVGTGGAVATGGTSTGGTSVSADAGTADSGTADNARYNFEQSIQSWLVPTGTLPFTSLVRSTAWSFAGQASLAGTVAATAAAKYQMEVSPTPAVTAGTTVTFHVFMPRASTIDWIQPYVREGAPGYRWTGTKVDAEDLAAGAWNTITVTVPADAVNVVVLGVQFHVTAAWTGTVFVDSVDW